MLYRWRCTIFEMYRDSVLHVYWLLSFTYKDNFGGLDTFPVKPINYNSDYQMVYSVSSKYAT